MVVPHSVVLAAAVCIDCCVEPLALQVPTRNVLVSEVTLRGARDVGCVVTRSQLKGVLELYLAEYLGVCLWNYEIPHGVFSPSKHFVVGEYGVIRIRLPLRIRDE